MRAQRIALGSIATLALVGTLSLAMPAVVLGSNGFNEKATTTYVVNPEKQRIDVTIDLTFKNTKKPSATILYYYNSEYIWLEKDATNLKATGNFSSMRITKEKTSGQYSEYRFHWEPVVFYGKTKSLHITYQIPSGAPRSNSWFRISPAYLDFCVISTGLDGGSTTVKVPIAYRMSVDTEEGGKFGERNDGVTRTYTTGNLPDATKFWGCLSGEQDDKYVSTKATSPSGREIDIQAWPDDPTWATEIGTQLDPVLTDLEALVGAGLPGKGPISIREVGVGSLGQYAGFFDPETGVARIGEDLEAKGLITHELSHAWFNGDLFQAHWLSEGYAEWARISIDTDHCPAPASYPGKGSPNLENWQFAGPRATDEELDVIDYQYAASCALISQVATRIGDGGMRAVLDALLNHHLAYSDGVEVLTSSFAAASWQTWLDAVDEIGLAKQNAAGDAATIADLLAPYGITASSRTTLKTRADARGAYHTLQALLGEWQMPPTILQNMAGWHFDLATSAMKTATEVYNESAEVETVLPGASGMHGEARTQLESATSQRVLDLALQAADARLAAAHAVADARTALGAPRDLVAQVGLIGTDLQPTLDAAIKAVVDDDAMSARAGADAIQAALADAPKQGQLRLMLAIGIPLLLLLLLIVFLVFRRRRRRGAALALATTAGTPSLAELDAALAPPPPTIVEAPPPPTTVVDGPPPPPLPPASEPGATPPPLETPPAP
ncbi:MAG TPA: hypothetical protein VJ850_14325 [Candidatus Limnocylindrales bacterium]|nr:hypothetical protein [Candidatus Limnocylindrales bacterium]